MSIITEFEPIAAQLKTLPLGARIEAINQLRAMIHDHSPMKGEPVDLVLWVRNDTVHANGYNPNSVAPPEMELLRTSILADGYTQPIVTAPSEQGNEVVDGFHRNRVGKECKDVLDRLFGYLPIVRIKDSQTDLTDRMASTIRHNRARGKHKVEAMSDIVVELKRRNWSDEKIAKSLGMDMDEVLRLCQITGLVELFADQEFSKSWDVEGEVTEADFADLSDDVSTYSDDETANFRTVNTSDSGRIFHTYAAWECHKAGFYEGSVKGKTKAQCEEEYRAFLADEGAFATTLERVIVEWKNSCEHYLTNTSMNRIAWLGQAAACYARGLPSAFRSGFSLLSEQEQERANQVALTYLNRWLVANGRPEVDMKAAYSGDRQADIY